MGHGMGIKLPTATTTTVSVEVGYRNGQEATTVATIRSQ
jgi:hypothetical protein